MDCEYVNFQYCQKSWFSFEWICFRGASLFVGPGIKSLRLVRLSYFFNLKRNVIHLTTGDVLIFFRFSNFSTCLTFELSIASDGSAIRATTWFVLCRYINRFPHIPEKYSNIPWFWLCSHASRSKEMLRPSLYFFSRLLALFFKRMSVIMKYSTRDLPLLFPRGILFDLYS